MRDAVIEWLLGDFASEVTFSHMGFGAGIPFVLGIIMVCAAIVAASVLYGRSLSDQPARVRIGLMITRALAVGIALLLVLDPLAVGHRIKPGDHAVALVFDDSMSMRIAGQDGRSRGERLLETYASVGDAFEGYLEKRHRVLQYRLGAGLAPHSEMDALSFDARETRIVESLRDVNTDLSGTTIAGIVLFSDGVFQRADGVAADLSALANSAPVYTVGVEEPSVWRDIELTGLSVDHTEFVENPINVTVSLRATGLAGHEGIVEIVEGNALAVSETISIDSESQELSVPLEFLPVRNEWTEYQARVRVVEPRTVGESGDDAPVDRIEENNERRFVIDNREHEYDILFFSGRPNWENKFLRRALANDKQLRLVSLLAISGAERKFVFRGQRSSLANPLFEGFDEDRDRPRYDETVFLRLGVEQDELASGFPATPEEMYRYELVILSDAERALLTNAQLELLVDFVEKRGGTLLAMGGPRSFTEGGYAESLLDDILPGAMLPEDEDASRSRTIEAFRIVPTVEGQVSGVWTFGGGTAGDGEATAVPPWSSLNRFAMLRPGASVHAEAVFDDATLSKGPLFVSQPYGEGMSAVLATGDTWTWQMWRGPEDGLHEEFWKRLARSLVEPADDATYWRDKAGRYMLGTPISIALKIRNEAFEAAEGAQASVVVTAPSGTQSVVAVEESIEDAGLYTAKYSSEESGLHMLELVATDDSGTVVAKLNEGFLIEPDHREFRDARYDPSFLKRISEATGGERYALSELETLAQAIPIPVTPDSERVDVRLWNRPIFYVLLVLLMLPEWYLRRMRGRA